MLGDNRQTAQEYVTKWRRNAVFNAVRAFQIIKRAERSAFGERSYFNLVGIYGKGNVPAIAINSPIPDNEEEEDDGNCWRCILTPSRDLAYIEAAAPINPICVQLLHQ
jgi:hypothetical protein